MPTQPAVSADPTASLLDDRLRTEVVAHFTATAGAPREYVERQVCEQRLPGGFFIEHRSIAYEDYQREPGREQAVEQALRWIPLYVREFGPFDEGTLPHWTIVRFPPRTGRQVNEHPHADTASRAPGP
ncbi:hypothetical protein [Streptomyces sp. NPDC059063]|uniref:hypothetical protein n=1 Tax=unclassified Streptomyces TaxID=2593676 RepID=UPI0036C6DD07